MGSGFDFDQTKNTETFPVWVENCKKQIKECVFVNINFINLFVL